MIQTSFSETIVLSSQLCYEKEQFCLLTKVTKESLRLYSCWEKVWFSGIDQLVKRMIETCLACQANSNDNHPESLQMTELSPAPWHVVHADFCSPFLTEEYLLVVIDAYILEVSRGQHSELYFSSCHYAQIGLNFHNTWNSSNDNGPLFRSHELKAYMREKGVKHPKITPLWPQANSEAEQFMKPLSDQHTLKGNSGQTICTSFISTIGQLPTWLLVKLLQHSSLIKVFATSFLK